MKKIIDDATCRTVTAHLEFLLHFFLLPLVLNIHIHNPPIGSGRKNLFGWKKQTSFKISLFHNFMNYVNIWLAVILLPSSTSRSETADWPEWQDLKAEFNGSSLCNKCAKNYPFFFATVTGMRYLTHHRTHG